MAQPAPEVNVLNFAELYRKKLREEVDEYDRSLALEGVEDEYHTNHGDYQGAYYGVWRVTWMGFNALIIERDEYGSCSECDAFEAFQDHLREASEDQDKREELISEYFEARIGDLEFLQIAPEGDNKAVDGIRNKYDELVSQLNDGDFSQFWW